MNTYCLNDFGEVILYTEDLNPRTVVTANNKEQAEQMFKEIMGIENILDRIMQIPFEKDEAI